MSRAFWDGFFDGFSGGPLKCRLGFHACVTRDNDTHIWGECIRCGKQAGKIDRASVRRYIEAEEAEKARYAAILMTD